ncbi:hypothetical protein [Pseudovibrio sp. SCP19]|uniref:hypothetical protein n=1 Tax=Pseudovibrio sp. SCP19 TaxID=3141374 RepID=UPI0033350B3C
MDLVSFCVIPEHDPTKEGELDSFDMLKFIGASSKRISRSSIRNERLIAGVDFSFNYHENTPLGWKPHLYGIVITDDAKFVRKALKEVFPCHSQARRPVRTKLVSDGDWAKVLSYAYKNGGSGFYAKSSYRTQSAVSGRDYQGSRKNRLTSSQRFELSSYLLQHNVGDRLLLRGLRRDPIALHLQPRLRLQQP